MADDQNLARWREYRDRVLGPDFQVEPWQEAVLANLLGMAEHAQPRKVNLDALRAGALRQLRREERYDTMKRFAAGGPGGGKQMRLGFISGKMIDRLMADIGIPMSTDRAKDHQAALQELMLQPDVEAAWDFASGKDMTVFGCSCGYRSDCIEGLAQHAVTKHAWSPDQII